MFSRCFVRAAGAIVGSCVIAGVAHAQWAITNLPPLAGDDQCEARTMSSDGLVSAGVSYSAVNPSRPVRWSSTGAVTALQIPAGYTLGTVRGLSSDGAIAVGEVDSATVVMPIKWNAAGTAQLLTLLAGCNMGYATGVSLDGTVTTGVCLSDDPITGLQKYHPVIWGSTGLVAEFPIPAGNYGGVTYGRNNTGGMVVGSVYNSTDFINKAVRWLTPGTPQLLAVASTSGNSEAIATSADGGVTLGYSELGSFMFPVWWNATGSLDFMPSLDPASTFGSRPYALSWDGNYAVGRSWDTDGVSKAVRWNTHGNTIERLPLAAGAQDSRAFGVSGNGGAVVGWMRRTDGTRYAVKWAPPACPADINGDHTVSGADLGLMLAAWGTTGASVPSDLNHDGVVGGADLGLLLAAWGACP
jgi:hypothetical protein